MTTNNNITENDENFLKNFLKNFYHKIIDAKDFDTFEDISIKWMKNELENNDKDPTNFLKMMQNHKKHQIWFTSIMGFFYQHGIGCDVNRNMALELYLLIVNNKIHEESLNDNLNSQLHLIKENENEVNILQDFNIIIGRYLLSLFYYKDVILAKRESINFESTKKSAIADDAEAQNELGCCYVNGIGTEKDEKKAFEWFIKSANNGCSLGQCNLGWYCYLNGKGTNKNDKKAIEWFLKSAEGGDTMGQCNLGWYCYMNGIGTDKDEKKAFEWLLKSADNGNSFGQNNLGWYCYMNGIGTNKDEKKAFEWFLKSAESGNATGQSNLGYCYLNGKGISKNEKKAFELFLKSANDGCSLGQYYLGYCYEKV